MPFITTLSGNPLIQVGVLTLCYLAVLGGVLLVSGRASFAAQGFVYQGF